MDATWSEADERAAEIAGQSENGGLMAGAFLPDRYDGYKAGALDERRRAAAIVREAMLADWVDKTAGFQDAIRRILGGREA